ncbi:MAG TPA: hypothetical protein VFJ12_06945 [Segeticoccus sp.]|nr:hypothetical protein [Segeticoccus sp.]
MSIWTPDMARIIVPQPARWLSMNDRNGHWSQRSGPTGAWRTQTAWLARDLRPIPTPVAIDAVVHKSRGGRWDAHNLMPTVKACIDGVVDAGLIPDDDCKHLIRVSIEAGPKSASPNLTLTITTTEETK